MTDDRFNYWADGLEQEARYYDRIALQLTGDAATGRHFGFEYIQAKVAEYRQKAAQCRKSATAYRDRASN